MPYEEIMGVYRERTCFNSTRPAMLRQELFEASIREYPVQLRGCTPVERS